jgi:hypothetical protein
MRRCVALVVGFLALVSAPSEGGANSIEKLHGHLSVGYAKLFISDAPGGSLSFGGGVDYPLSTDLRAGVDLGFHLLGSRSVVRGSLVANIDYSTFEAVLFARWSPPGLGPVGSISAGPALFSARAELSSSGGGAGFTDLAVDDLAPGLALDVTLIRRSSAPVRVGLEVGTRLAFVETENWTLATARVAFHY